MRINTYEDEQTSALDTVIGQSEVIGKIAPEVYKNMFQPVNTFQFKLLEMYKLAKLTLQSLKMVQEAVGLLCNWFLRS